MAKWLVTGGAGFIGSNIVESLCKRGEEVRVVDNLITGKEENLTAISQDFEMIRGDVRDMAICREAVKDVDYVLHQAALGSVPRSVEDPITSHECNVTGTLNLLVAAKESKVKRFVCAGSSSVYGKNKTLPKREDMTPMPMSPYAVTKLAQENYCLAFAECYGMETAVLRYFNIFGPRQDPDSLYAAVIPKFITAASSGFPPEIHGDGEQSRDFTFVTDCVEANVLAATMPLKERRVFNVAGGRRVSINELWQKIKELTRSKVEATHVEARPGDVRHSLADSSAALDDLGWVPKVPVEEGLSLTVKFFTEKK